jgi:hypothetical protein
MATTSANINAPEAAVVNNCPDCGGRLNCRPSAIIVWDVGTCAQCQREWIVGDAAHGRDMIPVKADSTQRC